jgi:branched-chain amino acid transport system substrate-binding protein
VAIGLIGSWSGPEASSLDGAEFAVKAWVSWTNAHGGLAGHPVKLYDIDDQTNPATALTGVKELVQQDHVVAIVGEHSAVDQTWASYVEASGIPVVGGLSLNQPFLTNPDFFSGGTNHLASNWGELTIAKHNGPKIGVFYCSEAPACASTAANTEAQSKALGLTVAFAQSISSTAPSYAAQCQQIKSAGLQTFQLGEPEAVVARIMSTCRQAGVTAQLVGSDSEFSFASLSDPNQQGSAVIELDFPYTVDSTPATQEFHQALQQYASNIGSALGPSAAYGWVAGQLLAAAVRASGNSDITAASVKKGLYALPKGETLDGLAPPLSYTEGQANPVNCYFIASVGKGKLETPDGLATQCAPANVNASVSG